MGFVVPARERGYTLIEVLVALFVTSVGLLGMAGLQVASLKQNQSAYMRSQATILAYDIVDRMRANVASVQRGEYFIASGSATTGCETTAGCSDIQMAAHDVSNWQARLAEELPLGGGRVCRDINTDDSTDNDITQPVCGDGSDGDLPIVVYVWWNDERNEAVPSTRLAVSVSL